MILVGSPFESRLYVESLIVGICLVGICFLIFLEEVIVRPKEITNAMQVLHKHPVGQVILAIIIPVLKFSSKEYASIPVSCGWLAVIREGLFNHRCDFLFLISGETAEIHIGVIVSALHQ